jgi:hypothetical protein
MATNGRHASGRRCSGDRRDVFVLAHWSLLRRRRGAPLRRRCTRERVDVGCLYCRWATWHTPSDRTHRRHRAVATCPASLRGGGGGGCARPWTSIGGGGKRIGWAHGHRGTTCVLASAPAVMMMRPVCQAGRCGDAACVSGPATKQPCDITRFVCSVGRLRGMRAAARPLAHRGCPRARQPENARGALSPSARCPRTQRCTICHTPPALLSSAAGRGAAAAAPTGPARARALQRGRRPRAWRAHRCDRCQRCVSSVHPCQRLQAALLAAAQRHTVQLARAAPARASAGSGRAQPKRMLLSAVPAVAPALPGSAARQRCWVQRSGSRAIWPTQRPRAPLQAAGAARALCPSARCQRCVSCVHPCQGLQAALRAAAQRQPLQPAHVALRAPARAAGASGAPCPSTRC